MVSIGSTRTEPVFIEWQRQNYSPLDKEEDEIIIHRHQD